MTMFSPGVAVTGSPAGRARCGQAPAARGPRGRPARWAPPNHSRRDVEKILNEHGSLRSVKRRGYSIRDAFTRRLDLPGPPRLAEAGLRRYSLTFIPGDVRCHLADEVLEVAQSLEAVDDDVVVDPDVVMNQDIAEAHRLADGPCQRGSKDAVLAEQSDRVAVVGWRSPSLGCADVLGDVHARLDRGDERVLDAPDPDGVIPAVLIGARLVGEHRNVVGDAAQQPQDPVHVDHALPLPGRDGGGEFPVGAGDPGQLVEVDLPGHRLPADSRDLVVFEQQPPGGRHPPGQLKRRVVKDQQVPPGGEQDLEGTRRPAAEVRRDVYVRAGACLASGTAAVQVSETRSRLPEHGDGLRDYGLG